MDSIILAFACLTAPAMLFLALRMIWRADEMAAQVTETAADEGDCFASAGTSTQVTRYHASSADGTPLMAGRERCPGRWTLQRRSLLVVTSRARNGRSLPPRGVSVAMPPLASAARGERPAPRLLLTHRRGLSMGTLRSLQGAPTWSPGDIEAPMPGVAGGARPAPPHRHPAVLGTTQGAAPRLLLTHRRGLSMGALPILQSTLSLPPRDITALLPPMADSAQNERPAPPIRHHEAIVASAVVSGRALAGLGRPCRLLARLMRTRSRLPRVIDGARRLLPPPPPITCVSTGLSRPMPDYHGRSGKTVAVRRPIPVRPEASTWMLEMLFMPFPGGHPRIMEWIAAIVPAPVTAHPLITLCEVRGAADGIAADTGTAGAIAIRAGDISDHASSMPVASAAQASLKPKTKRKRQPAKARKKPVGPPPITLDWKKALPRQTRDAQTELLLKEARVYDQGSNGKGQNKEKAGDAYRQAAERGDAQAQYVYAYMLDNGEGLKKDHQEALLWYQRAAEAGNLRAIHELAFKFDHGLLGVEQHPQLASDLYRLSQRVYQDLAASGDTAAEYRVGRAYLSGEYGVLDREKGRALLQRAAAKGHALARMLVAGALPAREARSKPTGSRRLSG